MDNTALTPIQIASHQTDWLPFFDSTDSEYLPTIRKPRRLSSHDIIRNKSKQTYGLNTETEPSPVNLRPSQKEMENWYTKKIETLLIERLLKELDLHHSNQLTNLELMPLRLHNEVIYREKVLSRLFQIEKTSDFSNNTKRRENFITKVQSLFLGYPIQLKISMALLALCFLTLSAGVVNSGIGYDTMLAIMLFSVTCYALFEKASNLK